MIDCLSGALSGWKDIPKKWAVPAVAILLTILSVGGVSAQPASVESAAAAAKQPQGQIMEELGIKVVAIRLSASDKMLDFRYKVLDLEKSRPMFDRGVIPYLVHEATGAQFAVPAPAKLGPMRQTTRQAQVGRNYFILFANPDAYVKRGDKVTVVIGEHRLEHLTVE